MPTPDPPAAYAHGEAHLFRIGLAPIEDKDWFEGPYGPADGDPASRKAAIFAGDPDLCWGETEGSRPAQAEALARVAAHFGATPPADLPPLRAAAHLVEDDLCLMERRGGEWTLSAASLCAPSFFSANTVVGKSLSQLHEPVTGFGDRLLPRVDRIFTQLPEDQLVERRNWSVVSSGELFLPDERAVRSRQSEITSDTAGLRLFVRMERQTLRRLPQTGALLFTIRIWRHPLSALRERPERLAAFARAWDLVMTDDGEAFRNYKQLGPLDPLVRSFLAETGASPT
jgi:hypothetical protein